MFGRGGERIDGPELKAKVDEYSAPGSTVKRNNLFDVIFVPMAARDNYWLKPKDLVAAHN